MSKLMVEYFDEFYKYLKKDDSLRTGRDLVDDVPKEAKQVYAEYLRLYNEAASRGERLD